MSTPCPNPSPSLESFLCRDLNHEIHPSTFPSKRKKHKQFLYLITLSAILLLCLLGFNTPKQLISKNNLRPVTLNDLPKPAPFKEDFAPHAESLVMALKEENNQLAIENQSFKVASTQYINEISALKQLLENEKATNDENLKSALIEPLKTLENSEKVNQLLKAELEEAYNQKILQDLDVLHLKRDVVNYKEMESAYMNLKIQSLNDYNLFSQTILSLKDSLDEASRLNQEIFSLREENQKIKEENKTLLALDNPLNLNLENKRKKQTSLDMSNSSILEGNSNGLSVSSLKTHTVSHIVAQGDTLSNLSLTYYGTSKKWPEIYEANKEIIPNKNQIKVGLQLIIP